MTKKPIVTVTALGLVGLVASSWVTAAEVQCPPGEGEVDVRVVPQVEYHPGRGIYTYRYTLESFRSSRIPVIGWDIPVTHDKVQEMGDPEGWLGSKNELASPGNRVHTVGWFAHKVEHPNRIAEGPEIPKSISALAPGNTVDGFVIESPLPPGPKTAYVTGEVRIEPVSSEQEMERMYAECESVGQTLLEAAKKVRTAGPAEGDFRPIRIDIMPGSAENPVNPDKQGVVPVAVLGGSDLAVSQIDPASLRFGPEGATPAHRNHESRDIDGDGLLDLLVHFDGAEAGLACLDSVAFVQGETVEGDKVQGFDTLTTPGCRGQGQNPAGRR